MKVHPMFFPNLSLRQLLVHPLRIIAIGTLLLGSSTVTAQIGSRMAICNGPTPRERLSQYILPSVEFHQTKLSAAVATLQSEVTRLYPDVLEYDKGNPARYKVNIAVRPLPASTPEPRITLTLNQIPLLEALKYVADQAGLKLKVEPYAVSFVPLTEPDELVTATFRVAPGTFGNKMGVGSGTNALDQGAATTQ